MALLGRPSWVNQAWVAPVRGLSRYRPFCVPDQMDSGPSMYRLLVLSLPVATARGFGRYSKACSCSVTGSKLTSPENGVPSHK